MSSRLYIIFEVVFGVRSPFY